MLREKRNWHRIKRIILRTDESKSQYSVEWKCNELSGWSDEYRGFFRGERPMRQLSISDFPEIMPKQ